MITRRLHLVVFALLVALGSAPLQGAAPGTVSGVVRDTAGVPQIGAIVQLLAPDQTVIASVFTNDKGRFSIPSVQPGRYALKAICASFLPSMREDLHIRSNTIVNLTMNTLYEVMQWLPAEPRAGNAQADDWKWTLRSAANRPLLRWLEDGPLVVVSDNSGAHKLKARLMASGQEGTFGESGERFSASVEDTPSDSRELLARVDFSPDSNAGMESMLGFRQDLGYIGSVQSVAAVSMHPDVDGAAAEGLQEAAMNSSEIIRFGDALEAEVGSEQVLARFTQQSPNTIVAALPYASVAWRNHDSTLRYQMTTFKPVPQDQEETEARSWLPALSMRNGQLALEHGLHQELGWRRQTENSSMGVLVYTEHLDNPVLEAMSHFAAGDSPAGMLLDRSSDLLRAAGPEYSSSGLLATLEHRLPGGSQLRFSYANGDAVVIPSASRAANLSQWIAQARPRHAQMYSLSLSGTLEGSGTHWRASYRWQPEDTLTQVAPFASEADAPYLNLHLRQSLHLNSNGSVHVEALLDVRNLLAEGYQPCILSDGSLLLFAQQQRALRGGLAFTF